MFNEITVQHVVKERLCSLGSDKSIRVIRKYLWKMLTQNYMVARYININFIVTRPFFSLYGRRKVNIDNIPPIFSSAVFLSSLLFYHLTMFIVPYVSFILFNDFHYSHLFLSISFIPF